MSISISIHQSVNHSSQAINQAAVNQLISQFNSHLTDNLLVLQAALFVVNQSIKH